MKAREGAHTKTIKTDRRRYNGSLATPLPNDISDQAWEKEIYRRLRLLCRHYGIRSGTPPERLQELAIALAFQHVPGFQILAPRRPRGRKKVWTDDDLAMLLGHVYLIVSEKPGRSVKKAVELYVQRNRLDATPATAYRRYLEAQGKWGKGLSGVIAALNYLSPAGALPATK